LSRRLRTYARIRTRKRYRAKRTSGGRVFIFTVGFIVFVVLSLYGLSYIKKKLYQEVREKRFSSSDIAELVEDVDRRVADALFNLGVSIKEVRSKNVSKIQERGITWEFKDIRIDIPEGITKKKVQETLTKSLSEPYIHKRFKKSDGSLISEIEIHDIATHKLRLVFYAKVPAKESKETVKEEKVSTSSIEQAKIIQQEASIRKPETKIFREERPKVIIIVDDLGLNREPIDELIKLPAPLNFAILPNLPYSRYAAEMAHRKGWDVILHLPMEPNDSSGYTGVDAGDGVLLVGLSKKEILAKLERNLASVPHIKGVNNHMGSKFTENSELMGLVLQRIQNEGLFFIDSKTSKNTTGYEIAKKLKIKTAQRDVFLDQGSQGVNYIKSQIEKLISISKEKGHAVGICHPYPDTLIVLSDMIPKIKEEVDIIPASRAVN
jgi:polysaccharide deacetylase 2 family uncharacterized protein YibQ